MRTQPSTPRRVSLRELLPRAKFHASSDILVGSCSCDSRGCRPGDLFAAQIGTSVDGHEFVPQALARGAAAILAERLVPTDGKPLCLVPDSREAFARICQALAGQPSDRLRVIGVTGTNGKTTTACLIAGVLKTAGHSVGLSGTLGATDGESVQGAAMTTPPAPLLADWLARCADNGCSHAVMEVSSHGLSQSRAAGIRFDVAAVTNIRRDHLDYHNTLSNYRRAKGRLFEHLAPDGVAILNADDPVSSELLDTLPGPALTVGIRSAAEVTATLVERVASEQTFLLSAGDETAVVRTAMIGNHHLYNCLTAVAVGLVYGVSLPTIARGLENIEHVPGRLERIECGQPFGVFVDYAHTADALTASLKTLRDVTAGRLICVFGAGGDRDRAKRPLMGRAVESAADLAVITNDNPRSEYPDRIIRGILRGFESAVQAQVITDRAAAIGWALAEAREGDCVLIAGKGHENYQQIGRRRLPFDDRAVARTWLYKNNATEYAPSLSVRFK